MRVLEIVHLRSGSARIDGMVEGIRASMGQTVHGPPAVHLFRRHGLETDLSIHIQADASDSGQAHAIALKLASELRAYGLVDHTRWEELP
jgi:hypothetical protein